MIEPGVWVPISFATRQLNSPETNYSTSELELLAVVRSTYHSHYYIYGNRFELVTDHKALLSALNNNRANKCYQSRLVRWVDKLLPFDFTVKHLAGSEMGITDYLSRDASGEPEKESVFDEKFVVASVQNFFNACNYIRKLGKSYSGAKNTSANLNEAKSSKSPASFISSNAGANSSAILNEAKLMRPLKIRVRRDRLHTIRQ